MACDNFYEYLNGEKKLDEGNGEEKPLPESKEEIAQAIAQDEAIVDPWTHRVTIYCNTPSKEFLKEIEGKNGVVAVFVKEKNDKPGTAESAPPDDK